MPNWKLPDRTFPVYILIGSDRYEIREAINLITQKVMGGVVSADVNTYKFFSKDLSIDEFLLQTKSYPAFSDRQLFIVHDFHSWDKKRVLEYISKPQTGDTVVVFIANVPSSDLWIHLKLIKESRSPHYFLKEFNEQNDQVQKRKLLSQLGNAGIGLTPVALEYVITNLSPFDWAIEAFITDLQANFKYGDLLALEQIEDLLRNRKHRSPMDLCNHLFSGQFTEAEDILHSLYQGKTGMITVSNEITRQWRYLLASKIHINNGKSDFDIISLVFPGIFKTPNFRPHAQSRINQAKNWQPQKLKYVANLLWELDLKLKSHPKEVELFHFENLLLSIARLYG